MRRRHLSLPILWATVAAVAQPAIAGPIAAEAMRVKAAPAEPILLDGRCDEAAWAKGVPTPLDEALTLSAVADRDGATLCWRFPVQTLALDLYIEDAQGALHDLHVSAQTGERTRTAQGWPDWAGFGQHRGWYAPPSPSPAFAPTTQARGTSSSRPRLRASCS